MERLQNNKVVKQTINLFSGLGFTELTDENPNGDELNFILSNPKSPLDDSLSIWVSEYDLEDGNGTNLYYNIFDGMSTLHITTDVKESYDYYISNFN